MVKSKRNIIWNEISKQFFKEAIIYIRKSSPQNADKVKFEILRAVRQLADFPEIHSPDKFKANNPGFSLQGF
jgi:plasmid stabilization system protein ParE